MDHSLHILLYRAFHAQRNFLRPSLAELGLGAGQPKVLDYLAARGPCCQRQLADYFDVDPANISRMVESLERGGFVVRRCGGDGRRREVVAATEKGTEISRRWRERCREAEEVQLRGFTSEERARFADYLARSYRNLRGGEEEAPWES